MFSTKYKVTILDSKWSVVKNNIKLLVVPRQGEYIYLDNKYVKVINVVHSIDIKHTIFIVVEDILDQPANIISPDNQ